MSIVRPKSERRDLLNIVGVKADYPFEISRLRARILGISRVDRLYITTSIIEVS